MLLRTYKRRRGKSSQSEDWSQDSQYNSQDSSQDIHWSENSIPWSQESLPNSSTANEERGKDDNKNLFQFDNSNVPLYKISSARTKTRKQFTASGVLVQNHNSTKPSPNQSTVAERTGLPFQLPSDNIEVKAGLEPCLVPESLRMPEAGEGIVKKAEENGEIPRPNKPTQISDLSTSTSSLLHAQESGEMAEQLDEAHFALDGLRQGQAIRVMRASIATLAAICASEERRRMLRMHGLVKNLLKAVIRLPALEDKVLTLGTSALLFFLASDGSMNRDLYESDSCLRLLLQLIQPSINEEEEDASQTKPGKLGGKKQTPSVSEKASEARIRSLFRPSSAPEFQKGFGAQKSIVPASPQTPRRRKDFLPFFPCWESVRSDWLALLALEVACGPCVLLDEGEAAGEPSADSTFKEMLGNVGGLDIVCQLAANCVYKAKELLGATPAEGSREESTKVNEDCAPVVVGMLLRCLRVLENVTFYNERNQRLLVEMRSHVGKGRKLPVTFLGLLVEGLGILSDLHARLLANPSSRGTSAGCTEQKESRPAKRERPPIRAPEMTFPDHLPVPRDGARNATVLRDRNRKPGFDPHSFTFDVKAEMHGRAKGSGVRKLGVDGTEEDGKLPGRCSGSAPVVDCLISAVKVLMNVTNGNATGGRLVVAAGGLTAVASLASAASCCRQAGEGRPSPSGMAPCGGDEVAGSDLLMVCLGVLVNLVEKEAGHRSLLAHLEFPALSLADIVPRRETSSPPATVCMVPFLCSLFLSRPHVQHGKRTDADRAEEEDEAGEEGDWEGGQREAEETMVEAYSALLLGFLSSESQQTKQVIAHKLPGRSTKALVPVLEHFLSFHQSLNTISLESHDVVQELIDTCKVDTTS